MTKDHSASDFASLARRISGLTSNLLATAIVLVVGLVCLRQVWQWWQGDDAPNPTATAASETSQPPNLAAGGLPQSLSDPLTLHTNRGDFTARQLRGSKAEVLAALHDECKTQLSLPPLTSPVIGPRERQFLAATGDMTLVSSGPKWQIYECKAEWPLVALVREIPGENEESPSSQRYAAHIAFALPAGPHSWMQYAVRLSKVER